jgi:hypothetical protein
VNLRDYHEKERERERERERESGGLGSDACLLIRQRSGGLKNLALTSLWKWSGGVWDSGRTG